MPTSDTATGAHDPEESPAAQAVRTVVDFDGLAIAFDDQILAPRAWTVAQSAWAADLLSLAPPGPVLELCSGAGHIGLRAVRDHARDLVLVDASEVASAYARLNAAAAGMADRVTVLHGRLDVVVAGHRAYALILADPPWVASGLVSQFPEDPPFAIDGGEHGLDVVWACLSVIGRALREDGDAVLQIGSEPQVDAVREYLAQHLDLDLEVRTHRVHDRGVLVHLRRPSAASAGGVGIGLSG